MTPRTSPWSLRAAGWIAHDGVHVYGVGLTATAARPALSPITTGALTGQRILP